MLDLLEKGWNTLFGSSTVDLGDSSLIGSDGFITRGFNSATDFLGSKAGKSVAGFASKALFGEDKLPEFGTPKGSRVSAPRGSTGAAMAKAGSVDMGMTARVQNAARIASNNAQAGSPIQGTFQRLQARQARGPLLRLESSQIAIKPRAVS